MTTDNKDEGWEKDKMCDYCRGIVEDQRRQHDKDIRSLEKDISELEKLMDAKFSAQQTAVEKAAETLAVRLEQVNEFRAQMDDQTKTFITRDVVDANVKELARRVHSLENKLAGYDGRIIGWSGGVGAVVLIITIVLLLLNNGG